MSFSSTRYLLKEGLKNVWSNRMMSFASIGVLVSCLLITGVAFLFSLNIDNMMGSLEGNTAIRVILGDEVQDLEAVSIGQKLKEISNIDACTFISKEEAFELLKKTVGDDAAAFEELGIEKDFLPFAYTITLNDLSKYDQTIAQVKELDGVFKIDDKTAISDKLTQIRQFVTSAGFWIVLLLLIISMFIISNTIRVTMFSRRLEISIMKSVGATDWFIRVPFIVEGIIIGLVSGLVTTGLLYYIYNAAVKSIQKAFSFPAVSYTDILPILTAAFLSIGAVFGILGGVISISRYLKGEGGDIVDW